MALSKLYLFSLEEREVAEFGFVLSHPARQQIIELLSTFAVLPTDQIFDYLPLSQTAVSDHLRYLERAKLIEVAGTIFGTSGYKLCVENYESYCLILDQFFARTRRRKAA
ncbi:MAG: ArsR family transcriptional regulator [Bacteroidota bacterium]